MYKKRIAALLLALALLFCCAACGSSETGTESGSNNDADTTYLFGVEVYDTTDPECLMYYNYLRDYIAESFPVEFIMSDSVNTVEEELSFVQTVKEEGGSGIIGIFTADFCRARESGVLLYQAKSLSVQQGGPMAAYVTLP